MNFGACEEITKDSKIKCEEHKRKIIFNNPGHNEIRRIRIDGCVINDGARCDFLVIDKSNNEHYVELKGSDIKHAVDQIVNTVKYLKLQGNKEAFIVTASCPLTTSEIQDYKAKLKKNLNIKLFVAENQYEHGI